MVSLLQTSTILIPTHRYENHSIVGIKRRGGRCIRLSISSSSNSHSMEQLRTQLNELHSEAYKTRDKANNARMRLLRLSEAAEKLRRQAAIDVQIGKENEARELLVQKKKVMQALENSKRRVELLDELLTKLNEAIVLKETQLVGNVALGLETDEEDPPSIVRLISPKKDILEEKLVCEASASGNTESDKEEVHIHEECKEMLATSHAEEHAEDENGVTMRIGDEDDLISIMSITSYEDFLDHVDKQLRKVETELVTVLNLSTLLLQSEEKPKNSKVQQTLDILELVRGARGRIASIEMKAKDFN